MRAALLTAACALALIACSGVDGAERAVPAGSAGPRTSSTFAVVAPTTAVAGAPPTMARFTTTTSAPVTTAVTTTTSSTAPATTSTTTTTTLPPTPGLELFATATITGEISPKSIVASGDGFFIAQNMMYRHTMTVYDSTGELVATIPDTVDLAAFGHDGFTGESYRGAPVEAAFTSDGSHVYVSNYQMYGEGFGRPGGDDCDLADWDESFVYRINTATWEIDEVLAVGAVPKYLALTPDDAHLLVSNWCSFDLSLLDATSGAELARIDIGRHPRGIAVAPEGDTAYVAIMGSRDIAVVDLDDHTVTRLHNVGANPRHLVISPDGSTLYATLNGEGRIARIDLDTGEVVAKAATGRAPRSMAISTDGASLYVVNYHSDTVSKVATATMEEVQEVDVGHHPIGIAYDRSTGDVWVSSYSGSITIFEER